MCLRLCVRHEVILLFVLEEKFAQSVCFLLVDLYLLTFQPEKALHLLAVLDKLSAQGNNKNSKGEVPHCSLLPQKLFPLCQRDHEQKIFLLRTKLD